MCVCVCAPRRAKQSEIIQITVAVNDRVRFLLNVSRAVGFLPGRSAFPEDSLERAQIKSLGFEVWSRGQRAQRVTSGSRLDLGRPEPADPLTSTY